MKYQILINTETKEAAFLSEEEIIIGGSRAIANFLGYAAKEGILPDDVYDALKNLGEKMNINITL